MEAQRKRREPERKEKEQRKKEAREELRKKELAKKERGERNVFPCPLHNYLLTFSSMFPTTSLLPE
jgi:hypothetical protein